MPIRQLFGLLILSAGELLTKKHGQQRTSWRFRFYAVAGAVAAVLIAVWAYDASGMALNGRVETMRARSW
jgi:hypothetical protein